MKMPHTRQTTAKGSLNGYANYETYEDSLQDLILWLNYSRIDIPTNLDTFTVEAQINWYVYAIKSKGFFTDTFDNYYKGTLNGYKKLFL